MMLKFIVPFLLLIFISCKGQYNSEKPDEDNPRTEELGTETDQIPERTWHIFQDKQQHYWFGSDKNGLIHYDGEKLIKYTTEDGLPSNHISEIQEDHLGNIFIQTGEGISKFDGSTFTTLKLSTSSDNEWKLEPNDLWFNFNCNANDVYRYDGESLYELKLPRKDLNKAFETEVVGLGFKDMNSSPYAVYGIDKDKDGNLWIGTIVAGAFRYDGDSFLWIPEKELTTLPDGRVPGVRSMIQDKNGFYWLSNFKSMYKINDNNSVISYEKLEGVSKSHPFFKGRIPYFNSGTEAENGDIWMTTYTSGVWRYDGKELLNYPLDDGETEVYIRSIYQDNQGVVWAGTENAGFFRFNGNAFETFEPVNTIKNR